MQSTRKPRKPVVFKYKVGDIVRLKSEYISHIDNPEYKTVVKIAKIRRSKNQPYYLFEGLEVWQHEAYIAGPVRYETCVSTTTEPSHIPANTSIMPDELVINDVKYRSMQDDKTRKD